MAMYENGAQRRRNLLNTYNSVFNNFYNVFETSRLYNPENWNVSANFNGFFARYGRSDIPFGTFVASLIQPHLIIQEISRWRLRFNLAMSFKEVFEHPQKFLTLHREPTWAEKLELLQSKILWLFSQFFKTLTTILRTIKFTIPPIIFTSIILGLLKLINYCYYKSYTQITPPEKTISMADLYANRPDLHRPLAQPPNHIIGGHVIPYVPPRPLFNGQDPEVAFQRHLNYLAPKELLNYRNYPVEHQNRAKELITEMNEFLRKKKNHYLNTCPVCRLCIIDCTCEESEAILRREATSLDENITRKRIELQDLYDDDGISQFKRGTEIDLPLKTNFVARFINNFCTLGVRWKIMKRFEIEDRRPGTEKHICTGNSKFWLIRQQLLYIKFLGREYNFDRNRLNFFGPNRDLVISEDHSRYNRRGTLSTDFKACLKGLLENSIAIPVNHPLFVENLINPLKDASYIMRALHEGAVLPYWDF